MSTSKKTQKPVKTAAKKPAPAKKAAAPAKKAPAKKAVPAKKPAAKKPAPAKKPVPAKKAAPAKKPAPAKKAAPAAKKAAPKPAAKKAATPPKKAVTPAKKPVAPAKKPAAPAKKAAAPAKKPVAAPRPAAPAKKFGSRLPLPPPPPPPPKSSAVRQQALTPAQVASFKVRLAVELDYIKGNLNALTRDALRQQSESAGDVGIHSTHMADHGTDNFDRDINLLLASGRQEAIYAIEDALRRIEAGSFGDCEVCGNPIGFARLDAMPYAKMCVECKKDMEKGRGRPTFKPYSREASLQAPSDGEGPENADGGDGSGGGMGAD